VNRKIHFHLVLRLRLGLGIFACTGRRHCVVLSTGVITSSSNACQHGKGSSLGCKCEKAGYWIVDKHLPIDKAKYSRRLIFTTKIWVMTEISCRNKVTALIPQSTLAKSTISQTPDAPLSGHFFEQMWPQCIRNWQIDNIQLLIPMLNDASDYFL